MMSDTYNVREDKMEVMRLFQANNFVNKKDDFFDWMYIGEEEVYELL